MLNLAKMMSLRALKATSRDFRVILAQDEVKLLYNLLSFVQIQTFEFGHSLLLIACFIKLGGILCRTE